MKRRANSIKNGRKWQRIGDKGRTKAIRQYDVGYPRHWPPRRSGKRWSWGMPDLATERAEI